LTSFAVGKRLRNYSFAHKKTHLAAGFLRFRCQHERKLLLVPRGSPHTDHKALVHKTSTFAVFDVMRLMTPHRWTEKYFAECSRPAEITVRRWLAEGKVPGRKVGSSWFVDEHAWLADGDELVLQVLED
jgi:hypothetical protein